jgi:arylformamidase
MKLYDITHPLNPGTAHWPGDTPFTLHQTARIVDGSAVNLSTLTLSPHVGTHADAPYHYDQHGVKMAAVPLEVYLGPARVVSLADRQLISAKDLKSLDLDGVERLLIRTGSCPDPRRFNPHFTAIAADAIRHAAQMGIRLIGTDAHSVDPLTSKELPSHHACRDLGVLILENLNLNEVPAGDYELIALPLKLTDADGSPVRAVLRTLR